ncbi:MAG: hypothetical protein E6Q96_07140 [Cyclobacteriaceae bacterium]|nr:MAG: hypothetical protein E6Q96_07140 [Cyclobacteriaceae bacterium]
MKRAVAHILMTVFLMGAVFDLHDLSKVPYMINHFQRHQNKNNSFSISEFFDLHYGSMAEQHDEQEHEQHKGLPFKSHDCTSSHGMMVLTVFQPQIESSFSLIVSYSNFYESTYLSDFSQSIWQPPKQLI